MDYTYPKIGWAQNMEYGRFLSDYLELNASLSYSYIPTEFCNDTECGYDKCAHNKISHCLDISALLMVIPLPKTFRFIKVGTGPCYERDYWARDNYLYSYDTNIMEYNMIRSVTKWHEAYFGMDLVARVYVIDNARYELFASYRHKYLINSGLGGGLHSRHMTASIHLGVKF